MVMPPIGGRVMELSLGPKNLLYVNPRYGHKAGDATPTHGEWKNYGGSKVWPAPQGWSSENEWPGPPDAILDSGPYAFEVWSDGSRAFINLKSEHDEYSGVTLERTIELRSGSAIVRLHHKMRNTSQRRIRWSIWQVTQVDAANGLDVFMLGKGFHQTFGNEPYTGMAHGLANRRIHLRYEDQVAKFAVEAEQGWLASLDVARELVLAETFPITAGADYPDGGPVAFWVSGKGTFTLHGDTVDMSVGANGCDPHVETEIMGPLTSLAPGETSEFHTEWRVAAINAQEIISVDDCCAIGQRLAITDSSTRVTGAFGVFYTGRLQLAFFDRASVKIRTLDLGEVTPLNPVVLNESISLPANAVRCSLRLFDNTNQRLGTLDHAHIR
jgi:hypothetical protein